MKLLQHGPQLPRLMKDQPQILERLGPRQSVAMPEPAALNTRSMENDDLCFSYADDKARHAAELMHAVDQALQAGLSCHREEQYHQHSTGKADVDQTPTASQGLAPNR